MLSIIFEIVASSQELSRSDRLVKASPLFEDVTGGGDHMVRFLD